MRSRGSAARSMRSRRRRVAARKIRCGARGAVELQVLSQATTDTADRRSFEIALQRCVRPVPACFVGETGQPAAQAAALAFLTRAVYRTVKRQPNCENMLY